MLTEHRAINFRPIYGVPLSRAAGVKRTKPIDEERRCAACGTKLNKYHKGDKCYQHEEYKVPRLRGRKVKEVTADGRSNNGVH